MISYVDDDMFSRSFMSFHFIWKWKQEVPRSRFFGAFPSKKGMLKKISPPNFGEQNCWKSDILPKLVKNFVRFRNFETPQCKSGWVWIFKGLVKIDLVPEPDRDKGVKRYFSRKKGAKTFFGKNKGGGEDFFRLTKGNDFFQNNFYRNPA